MCVGEVDAPLPVVAGGAVAAQAVVSVPEVKVGSPEECSSRYTGKFFGVQVERAIDTGHFLTAGLVSFARGLNDTPKIAGLLLLAQHLTADLKFVLIATVMAIGGLLNARKVATTMSTGITGMNCGQGFAANLTTGALVTAASVFSLPVSTTHVSVGAIFGIGAVTGQANTSTIKKILLAWIITLPTAAILSALAYAVARGF